MMRSEPRRGNSKRTRPPATLSAKLNAGMISYVAAASAAGVGMLAAAQPVEAEVVYTPANTPILINTPVALDLNNDGIIDFELSNNYRAFDRKSCTNNCSFGADATLKVTPEAAENAIWAIDVASHRTFDPHRKAKKDVREAAAPIPWGVVVGPERKFQGAPTVMHSEIFSGTIFGFASYKSFGPWGEKRQFAGPYLGLKFTTGGEVHYGWARITVQANQLTITATLTGYAYETVANRPIITGVTHGTFDPDQAQVEPSELTSPQPQSVSLGQLALGAVGRAASKIQ
jgi:hypothetical protein